MEIDRFYAERAIEIVRAGTAQDRQVLDSLVAPDAKFRIWDADSGWEPRKQGTAAAIEFARFLKATRFQFWSDWSMVRVQVRTVCEWSASVMFETNDRDSSVLMVFKFKDGRLLSAGGQRVQMVQGSIP